MKLFGTLRELVAAVFRKDGHEITLRPNQTSSLYTNSRAVSLPQVDNDVVLTASGYIANADIAAAAGIVDSKLATISTAGKVSNSATTATDANTASAIVARDASGNFSAGTITASLSGNASTATTATNFSGSLSGEVTGTQSATVVASGVIDNDNISATAGIVDTKLATIATAGKVSNSATTATSSNTASAIVARDGSGNFSAGTISASGVNVSGLTVSRAVVTDGSKNLASLEYTTANTGSTLMARDVAGSTSVNTLTAANIDVTGLATMDKAYIDGSSGQGFIEFEGQTVGDVPAPTTGEARLFAGTDGKIYVRKAGSSQAEELGAGGSGEINLVDNSSDAGNWGVVNATATTNTTAANNPLSGTIDTSIAIASSTSGGYARYRFTMPSALKQRKLKLEWYQIASSLASGAYKVEVWTNASSDYSGAYTELSLSTDSSGTSSIPNLNGKYSTTFDTNGADYYEIRVVRTAASAATIYIANVVCGPGIQPQGAVVGEWQNFTPVTFGATTYSSLTGRYRRVGDSAHIRISAVINVASGTYWFDVPSSIGTIDTTKVRNGNYQDQYGVASYYNSPTVNYAGIVQKTNVANRVRIVGPNGSNEWSQSTNTPTTPAAGHGLELEFTVPIAEWAGSGTVQLAQNDVEYASNSGNVTAAGGSDTTSFAYGPNGTPILAYNSSTVAGNSSTSFRVQFQTPVQSGDQVVVEINDGSGWFTAAQRLPGINTSGASYGIVLVSNSSTQYTVAFGNAGFNASGAATYAAAGSPWSSITSWRWRVRKSSAGAAVGFGIVSPGVSAGLVSASGLPGNTTGNAIASGYVGQTVRDTTAAAANLSSTTNFVDLHFYDVPAGVWLVYGGVGVDNAASNTGADVALSINSGNTTTDHVIGYNVGQTRTTANSSFSATCGPFLMNVFSTTRVYLKGKAIGATTTTNSKSIWVVRIA